MSRIVLGSLVAGAALVAGAWLVRELQVPYSTLRLKLAELSDKVKGDTQ